MKITIKRYHLDLATFPCGTAVRTPYLSILVPGDLHWTNTELVAFANGLRITRDAIIGP
jgi:hypothetical protein